MAPSLEEPTSTSLSTSPQLPYRPNNSVNGNGMTASNKQPAMETSTHADKLSNTHGVPPVKEEKIETQYQHIWYITGPAGCGKSTVAQYIAASLKLPFLEGDNFHPQANITKMAEGHPLTDADRWDWLIVLRTAATRTLAGLPTVAPSPNAGGGGSPPPPTSRSGTNEDKELPAGVVLTCSALKRKYRDVLRMASYDNLDPRRRKSMSNGTTNNKTAPEIKVHFVYLHATEEVILQRVAARKGHYMGAQMVHSQFESLEVPDVDVEWDVERVEVDGTKEEVEARALRDVEAAVREDTD